jgi:hypothetical protein
MEFLGDVRGNKSPKRNHEIFNLKELDFCINLQIIHAFSTQREINKNQIFDNV